RRMPPASAFPARQASNRSVSSEELLTALAPGRLHAPPVPPERVAKTDGRYRGRDGLAERLLLGQASFWEPAYVCDAMRRQHRQTVVCKPQYPNLGGRPTLLAWRLRGRAPEHAGEI